MNDLDYARRSLLCLELSDLPDDETRVAIKARLAFQIRIHQILHDNPRICEFGCNTIERNPDRTDARQPYVPKTHDKFKIDDRQTERLRKMCAFINETMPLGDNPHGRKLIGSYGFKHVLEKQNWTEDTNRYVSNGEGILAMMLCGYKPRWSKDNENPNCVFSVTKIPYLRLVREAERR
jgi:hypothetical protein